MLYNIVLISAVHQLESAVGIHMSPPSGSSLLPPTPSHPSRLSQSTRFELPASYSKFPPTIYFTYGNVYQFSLVQSLSRVQLFVTPWTTARQASLSITNPQSLLRLMSIESVMPSNHLILCHPLLFLPSIFPTIRVFSMSQFFASGCQRIGVSPSASVLPMNTQD